jgi:NAD+ synthase
LTKTEVRAIAAWLGLPEDLVNKTPVDGLQPLSDEERLGLTYKTIDAYIRSTGPISPADRASIEDKIAKNKFKLKMVRIDGPDFGHYPDKVRAFYGV